MTRFGRINPGSVVRSRPAGKAGANEDLEGRVLQAIRGYGFPEPVEQHHFRWCCEHLATDHAGRRAPRACKLCECQDFDHPQAWAFDFAWPDVMLALEAEGGIYTGGAHGSVSGILRDIEKYNDATLRGWRVIRVTSQMVKDGDVPELLVHAGLPAGAPRI